MDKRERTSSTDSHYTGYGERARSHPRKSARERAEYGERARAYPGPDMSEQVEQPPKRNVNRRNTSLMHSSSPIAVGAKTIAGIGIGLIAVVGGAAVLGLAAEMVLIPSLLMKLAGGIAGGGVGMAKGMNDARPQG